MSIQYEQIGRNIRAIRKEQNLTQKQLAELLGCSTEHICHVERGDRRIQLEMLNSFCEQLRVSYEDVLFNATDAKIHNDNRINITPVNSNLRFNTIIRGCSDARIQDILDICERLVRISN